MPPASARTALTGKAQGPVLHTPLRLSPGRRFCFDAASKGRRRPVTSLAIGPKKGASAPASALLNPVRSKSLCAGNVPGLFHNGPRWPPEVVRRVQRAGARLDTRAPQTRRSVARRYNRCPLRIFSSFTGKRPTLAPGQRTPAATACPGECHTPDDSGRRRFHPA